MIRIDGFMSVSEMAEIENVSRQTIHNWIKWGYLDGLYLPARIGRVWLLYTRHDAYWGYPAFRKITREDLEEAIATVGDAAKQFGVSQSAIRKAIQDGRLLAHKAGGTWIFKWEHAYTLWGKTEETEK